MTYQFARPRPPRHELLAQEPRADCPGHARRLAVRLPAAAGPARSATATALARAARPRHANHHRRRFRIRVPGRGQHLRRRRLARRGIRRRGPGRRRDQVRAGHCTLNGEAIPPNATQVYGYASGTPLTDAGNYLAANLTQLAGSSGDFSFSGSVPPATGNGYRFVAVYDSNGRGNDFDTAHAGVFAQESAALLAPGTDAGLGMHLDVQTSTCFTITEHPPPGGRHCCCSRPAWRRHHERRTADPAHRLQLGLRRALTAGSRRFLRRGARAPPMGRLTLRGGHGTETGITIPGSSPAGRRHRHQQPGVLHLLLQ